jgi:hypothetical protein
MRSRLFTFLWATSLSLCLLFTVGWVASYWDWGGLEWERHVWMVGVREEAVGDWPPGIRARRPVSVDGLVDVEDKDGVHLGTVDGAFYLTRHQWRTIDSHGEDFYRIGDLSLQYHWPRRVGAYWSASGSYDLPTVGERWFGCAVRFDAGRDGQYITHLVLPCWALFVLTAALPSIAVTFALRRRRRRSSNLCSTCGYDLRASPGRCPECGMVPATATPASKATAP